jgi:hypothetical protein
MNTKAHPWRTYGKVLSDKPIHGKVNWNTSWNPFSIFWVDRWVSIKSEFVSYKGARNRCENKRSHNFMYYGGRGILFRFVSFAQFIEHLGPKPTPEHSLDRVNNGGHYEPGNVRWATKKEQINNRRCSNNF